MNGGYEKAKNYDTKDTRGRLFINSGIYTLAQKSEVGSGMVCHTFTICKLFISLHILKVRIHFE